MHEQQLPERVSAGDPPPELDAETVRARFRWARRRGHPRYLWPDLEPSAWRSALEQIERTTKRVLASEQAALETDNVRALGIAAFTSGMGPLLGYWIEEGRIATGEGLRSLLMLHLQHGRRRADVQREVLFRAVGALRAAGVEPIVLKSAVTFRYFPEPGTRTGVDVDLVVVTDAFARAEQALLASGHRRVGEQISPRKSDWLVPGAEAWPRSLELLHSGSQYGIDLHASLARDFFGVRRITIEGDTTPIDVAGAMVHGLAQPALLAFHALHASEGLDNLTLIRLVELVLMIRRDAGESLDWGAFLDLLERAGGLRFAWPALALTEKLAPGTVDRDVLDVLERASTAGMRRIVAGLNPASAQRLDVLSLRERFMWCATPADHMRRLLHMLLPAPAGRSPGRLARLYVDRAYRLIRGNIEVDRHSHDR